MVSDDSATCTYYILLHCAMPVESHACRNFFVYGKFMYIAKMFSNIYGNSARLMLLHFYIIFNVQQKNVAKTRERDADK